MEAPLELKQNKKQNKKLNVDWKKVEIKEMTLSKVKHKEQIHWLNLQWNQFIDALSENDNFFQVIQQNYEENKFEYLFHHYLLLKNKNELRKLSIDYFWTKNKNDITQNDFFIKFITGDISFVINSNIGVFFAKDKALHDVDNKQLFMLVRKFMFFLNPKFQEAKKNWGTIN